MIEINLIPDVKQELIRAQQTRAAVISVSIIVGIVVLAIVAILAVYVFAVQTVRGNVDDNNIKQGFAKLSANEDLEKIITIQNQLDKISALHDDTQITSRIFDVLEATIPAEPNNVVISKLTIDTDNHSIRLEGQAAQSYAAMEVFKKTLAAAKVSYTDTTQEDAEEQSVILASDISTSDLSYGQDSSGEKVLRFTLTFTYADELFAPSSGDIAITIDGQGNATDSYLGVPKSIFTNRATDIEEEE